LESRGAQASFCRHKTNLNTLIERGGDSVEHRQGMTLVASFCRETRNSLLRQEFLLLVFIF